MTTYTANLSLALILLTIFSANSIGIRLSAPAHSRRTQYKKIHGRKFIHVHYTDGEYIPDNSQVKIDPGIQN